MEAVRSSETSGTTQRTTRRHIPEDTLHPLRCLRVLPGVRVPRLNNTDIDYIDQSCLAQLDSDWIYSWG
jgi:hypothetical protein